VSAVQDNLRVLRACEDLQDCGLPINTANLHKAGRFTWGFLGEVLARLCAQNLIVHVDNHSYALTDEGRIYLGRLCEEGGAA